MNGLSTYQMYLAMKQHFGTGSYNFFKYNGKVRVNSTTFSVRRDAYFFERLGKKYHGRDEELRNHMASNFAANANVWIKDLVAENAFDTYVKWKAYQEALSYNFRQDCACLGELKLDSPNDLFFAGESGMHPPLLNAYSRGTSPETLLAFDVVFGCFDRWDKEIEDPIIWPAIRQFLEAYRPFIRIDPIKSKAILLKEFT